MYSATVAVLPGGLIVFRRTRSWSSVTTSESACAARAPAAAAAGLAPAASARAAIEAIKDAVRRVTRCIRTSPRARSSSTYPHRRYPCFARFGMGRRGASRQERAAASSSSRDASLTRGRCSLRPRSSSWPSIARQPSTVDEVRLALGEQRVDLPRGRASAAAAARRRQVLDEAAHGLLGVALVRAEDPGRAALDPADGVDAGQRLAVGREHAAALVGQHEVALVERHVGQRHRAVADRAQDEPALDRLDVVVRPAARAACRPRRARSRCGGRRPPRPGRRRGSPPASAGSAARSAAGRRRRAGRGRELAQQLDVLARGERALLVQPLARDRVELDLVGVDAQVDAVEAPELAQLGARERRLRRPAPAEHDDLLDRGSRAAPRARGRRCRCAPARSGSASRMRVDVRGDVAVADHDRALAPTGRTRARGSRGGRCTRRRTRWRPSSRAGPRRGSRATCRSARRSRRRPPCSGA